LRVYCNAFSCIPISFANSKWNGSWSKCLGKEPRGWSKMGKRLHTRCQNPSIGCMRRGQNDWPLQPCSFLESSPATVSLTPSSPLFGDLGFATAFICSLDSWPLTVQNVYGDDWATSSLTPCCVARQSRMSSTRHIWDSLRRTKCRE
jgi:hypothetical protein